jgi:UDP-N-acetylmuramyl pentapeptide synthase
MLAALRTLRSSTVTGRRVAVLGFMGELGDHEEPEHLRLGERVVEQGIEILVTVDTERKTVTVKDVYKGTSKTTTFTEFAQGEKS